MLQTSLEQPIIKHINSTWQWFPQESSDRSLPACKQRALASPAHWLVVQLRAASWRHKLSMPYLTHC